MLPKKNKNHNHLTHLTFKHRVTNNNNGYHYESITSNLAVDEDGAAADNDAAAADDDDDDHHHHHHLVRKEAIQTLPLEVCLSNLIAKNGNKKGVPILNRFIDVSYNNLFGTFLGLNP